MSKRDPIWGDKAERNKTIFELRNAKHSFEYIAKQVDASYSTVVRMYHHACKRLNQTPIKMYDRPSPTPLNKEIVELHNAGWRFIDLGKKFNLSVQNICNRYLRTCKQLGITPLHIHERQMNEERKQKMISLHNEGKNYREIGEVFDLSRQRAHQIIGGENIK